MLIRDENPGDIPAIGKLVTEAFRTAPHSRGTEAQCRAYKGVSAVDIPRIFNITESAHRIHNPFTPEKLATLGAALRLEPGTRVLDLGSGSGEMLCTWARDYGIRGAGIDMSQLFTEQAKLRADELGVAFLLLLIECFCE